MPARLLEENRLLLPIDERYLLPFCAGHLLTLTLYLERRRVISTDCPAIRDLQE